MGYSKKKKPIKKAKRKYKKTKSKFLIPRTQFDKDAAAFHRQVQPYLKFAPSSVKFANYLAGHPENLLSRTATFAPRLGAFLAGKYIVKPLLKKYAKRQTKEKVYQKRW